MGVNFPLYTITSTATLNRTVAEDVVIVTQTATPLLNAVSPGLNNLPIPAENIKFEWVERKMPLLTSAVQTTVTSTTATTFTVTAGHGEYFLRGHIVKIDSEHIVVTTQGTAADVVKAARGYGSTSGATHVTLSTLLIIGRVAAEGGTSPNDTYQAATIPWNAIQLFEQSFELSKTRRMENRYGENTDPTAEEEMIAMTDTALMMERQMIYGERILRTTAGSASALVTAGTFGGIPTFVTSGNKNAISSARLAKDDVDDLLAEIYALVGDQYMPDLVVCGSFNKRLISSWYESFRRTERTDTRGGGIVQDIETEWGVLDILLDWNMPADEVYFLHTPFLAFGPMSGNGINDGLNWEDVPLSNTPRVSKRHLSGQYTFLMKNPDCHGMITGTATS